MLDEILYYGFRDVPESLPEIVIKTHWRLVKSKRKTNNYTKDVKLKDLFQTFRNIKKSSII